MTFPASAAPARASIAAALLAALAACSPTTPEPAATPSPTPAVEAPPPAPPAPSLPTVDAVAIQALLSPDEKLETAEFEATGAKTIQGSVEGYKSSAWAVPVVAGQTLTVKFTPSNTNLYMNVIDTKDTSGEAAFRGETNGAEATLTPASDTVYVIRPYQPRAMARRNEKGDYTLEIARK